MFFRYVLFRCSPWPNSLVVRVVNAFSFGKFYPGYLSWYRRLKEVVKEGHFQELCKLDPAFLRDQQSKKLICAREEARRNGIGPMDPGYPDIFDFSDPDIYRDIEGSLARIREGHSPFWKGK